jgi:hypothetical protein
MKENGPVPANPTPHLSQLSTVGAVYFLGGHDLEMAEIARVLREHNVSYADHSLDWAHAVFSAYEPEIRAAIRNGQRPVLVELRDIPADVHPFVDVIDHHGPESGHLPTSLEQVLARLGMTALTREQALIAANDKGYIDGMLGIGATTEDIRRIRMLDRQAQGITTEQEADAVAAITARTSPAPGLFIVSLPHNKTATVTDRLSSLAGGPGYDNLLIECRTETDFFGDGQIIGKLSARFGGYCGGDLPRRGYWGLELGSVDLHEEVRKLTIEEVANSNR